MSQENVEIVRHFAEAHDGEDLMPGIREAVARWAPDPDPAEVLAWWADDPGWSGADPEIEWDTSAIPGVGTIVKGPKEVALWWVDWTNAWKSYIYRTAEYRDLGEWVLTRTEIEAVGPGDVAVEMTVFQMWKVRNGKIATCRVFPTEPQALEAAGLSE